MAKLGYYEEDGVEYWTLKALKEYLGVTDNALWYYRRLGALIRVRTEKGLYFRVNVGWEIRSSYILTRIEKGEKVIAKVGEDSERLRKREVRKETLQDDDYLQIYTAQEIMKMDGIGDLEFHVRMRNGIYLSRRDGRFMFRTDEEWEHLSEYRRKKWASASHGNHLVFKDSSEYQEKLDRICGV